MQKLPPIHPGEILNEEFLKPLQISQYRLAKDIAVSPRRINQIVHGTRSITADTALRLAQYFGNTPEFWMNLQTKFDLSKQKEVLFSILQNTIKTISIKDDFVLVN